MTKVFIMQFISCCRIQASEVVLIVSIRTVDSYVGKSTVGKNTGDQNWRNSMAYCFCDICDYKDECKHYRKVVVCPYIKTEE